MLGKDRPTKPSLWTPGSAIARANKTPSEKDTKTPEFTLQAPAYIPVMSYSDSEELRGGWRAHAALGRGETQNNMELVREILDLRHELAQLVGQKILPIM